MKLILPIILFSLSSLAAVKPQNGLYYCQEGNEESICDQVVKTFYSGDKLTAIKVEYVGWCGSMGPYMYYCDQDVCEDPGLKFEFRDATHYRSENKHYGFVCEMEKK